MDSGIKKILVVRNDKLGDFMLTSFLIILIELKFIYHKIMFIQNVQL